MSRKLNLVSDSEKVEKGVVAIGLMLSAITGDPLERMAILSEAMRNQVDAIGLQYDVVDKDEDDFDDNMKSFFSAVMRIFGDDEDDVLD